MDDAVIPVAYAMQASPKRYALFLGAGISLSAGLPSGSDVAAKMIRKLASAKGEKIEGDDDPKVCLQWFAEKFGVPATFDRLMQELGITEETRRERLQEFIFPTDADRNLQFVNPTTAHQIIAELVKDKIVSTIITTNFDPLLEEAIKNMGIRPVVIRSDTDPTLMSIFPDACRIIKVNGDFESLSIKITPEDLKSYEPGITDYIQRICAEYGLVFCGWSGGYDVGLQEILASLELRRYPTFWCLRSDSEIPTDLRESLNPLPVEIQSADRFFTSLQAVISRLRSVERVQSLTVSASIRRVTEGLQQPKPDIILSQLIHAQTDIVLDELAREGYVPTGTVHAQEIFEERVNILTKKTAPLAAMLATLAYYDDNYASLVYDAVERLINVRFAEPFAEGDRDYAGAYQDKRVRDCLYNFQLLPALIVIYTTGIAATKSEHFNMLEAVFTPRISGSPGLDDQKTPYFESVNISQIFSCDNLWVSLNREHFGESGDLFRYIHQVCHGLVRHLIPSDTRYSEAFDIFEYLFGLACLSTGADLDKILNDLRERKNSPLRSRVWNATYANGNIGKYVLPDSIRSYLRHFDKKIEGTTFFGGDARQFEEWNMMFAKMCGIITPDTGIHTFSVIGL